MFLLVLQLILTGSMGLQSLRLVKVIRHLTEAGGSTDTNVLTNTQLPR